jgi:hypothetical protein
LISSSGIPAANAAALAASAPGRQCGCAGGQRVENCRLGKARHRDVAEALGCAELEVVHAAFGPGPHRPHLAVLAETEEQSASGAALELGTCEHIVAVAHRHRVGAECRQQVSLLGGDLLLASEEFDVRRAHVGDHAHSGLRDGGQSRDLAPVVHAEFHHHPLVLGFPGEQRQGQAKLVVEVAEVLVTGARHAEDGGAHLLGARLSVAAGDRNQRTAEEAAVAPGQCPKGRRRIVHAEHRQALR